jgi:hypothetical protein
VKSDAKFESVFLAEQQIKSAGGEISTAQKVRSSFCISEQIPISIGM